MGRPTIHETENDRKQAHAIAALRCYYRTKGFTDEEFDCEMQKKIDSRIEKQKIQVAKTLKKNTMNKIKDIITKINELDIDQLNLLSEMISELSSDSE